MPDAVTPVYTTRAKIEKQAGPLAVQLRIDDDLSALAEVIADATTEVNGYCRMVYSTAAMVASNWITLRCTDIATMYLCERRLNKAPGSVKRRYENAIELLKQVLSGEMVIPDAAQSKQMAPVLSNQGVRLTPIPHVVTAREQSTGDNAGYTTNDDPTDFNPNRG